MISSSNVALLLATLLLFLNLASANTEKIIFMAPAAVPIPLAKQTISDLSFDTLTPDAWSIRMNLSRKFPDESRAPAAGAVTWAILDGLNPGQRYEVRVCWSAIQPTRFDLDVFDLDTSGDDADFMQSLREYAYSRRPSVSDEDQEPQVKEKPLQAQEMREASILLLRVVASADYFTDNVVLMKDPPPVLVDLILDPYLFNLLPKSLVPTVGYIVLVGIVTWFVARAAASSLQSFAAPHSAGKKQY